MIESARYKIFVINMAESRKRWLNISSQLDALNVSYERIDGVDASKLSPEELSKYYSDDAILSEKFLSAIRFLQEHPFEWDFIRLQPETKNRILYFQKKFSEFAFDEYIRTSGGAYGYAINISTARKLSCELLPFGCTADSNSHLYYKYGIDVLTIIPPVVFLWEIDTDRALDAKTKTKNYYPFSRQAFQLKSYIGKLFYLIKRDGFNNFLKRLINVKICKVREWKN